MMTKKSKGGFSVPNPDLKSSQIRGNIPPKGEAMTLGEKIRELRKRKNLTQQQLAEMAGIDDTYLSKIENDRLEYTPSIRTILDLAKALEVDELELLALAQKIPSPLAGIARDEKALRFFRRATEAIKAPSEWEELLRFLEERTGKRGV